MSALVTRGASLLERLYKGSRQARWAMGSQVVTSGANFATTLIIVRSLGLEEFGRFSVCFLIMMITRNFLNGMVLIPMSTIGPKLSGYSLRAYRGFLVMNGLVFSIGSSVLLLLLSTPLSMLLNAPWLPDLALSFALANCMANGADFVRRYHFVYEAPVWAFMVDAARFAVQISLLLMLAFVWQEHFSANTALYAMAIGGVIGGFIGSLHYGRISWHKKFATAVWPRHWNFIKWMTPNVALQAVESNAPLLIGGAMLGEQAIGLLRTIQQIANVLNLQTNALQQIVPSIASRIYARNGIQAMDKFLLTSTLATVLTFVFVISLLFSFFDVVIGSGFGLDVKEALPLMISYCLLNLVIILRFPFIFRVQVLEQSFVIAISNFVSSGLVLLISGYAISKWGIQSIPIITGSVACVSIFVYILFIVNRRRNLNDTTSK